MDVRNKGGRGGEAKWQTRHEDRDIFMKIIRHFPSVMTLVERLSLKRGCTDFNVSEVIRYEREGLCTNNMAPNQAD